MASSRKTRWVDARISFDVGNGAQNTQTLFPGAGQDTHRDSTIIWTIASLWFMSATTAGAWGAQDIDMGFGVISQDAIGAGNFPDPVTPADFPVRGWLFRGSQGVSQNGVAGGVLTQFDKSWRSQRKLDTGQYFLIANSTAVLGTAFSTRITGWVRTLLLLP